MLTDSVEGQTKTITLVRNGQAEPVRTRAETVNEFLTEQNIGRSPDDTLDVDPASALADGETIIYRAAVPVTLVVDGVTTTLRTTADTVGAVLTQQQVAYDAHDRVSPLAEAPLAGGQTILVNHVASWVEKIRKPLPAPVEHRVSFNLSVGRVKVMQKGVPGEGEIAYRVTRQADRTQAPLRAILASHVLRAPRARVIATGIGEYGALADFAKRGFDGTVRLAKAAISMVATAYTSNCAGCSGSGRTASGRLAGHGIVAVDPRIIPLGSHLYIMGYGHATAGDTGGAIRGNRIDLGFNSDSAAMQFGRRSVTVYVLHP